MACVHPTVAVTKPGTADLFGLTASVPCHLAHTLLWACKYMVSVHCEVQYMSKYIMMAGVYNTQQDRSPHHIQNQKRERGLVPVSPSKACLQ